MFKKLKEKLNDWTKKISHKEAEEPEVIEEFQEEKPVKKPKAKAKPAKKEKKGVKQIPIPEKFDVGLQKVVPDTEKLEELQEKIEEKSTKGSEETPKPGTKSFFQKVTSRIQKIKISEEEFEIYGEELRMLLLENNVAFEVADKIIESLKEEIVGKELLRKEIESEINEALKNILREILIEPFSITERIKEKRSQDSSNPYIILFSGVNGTGKTTTIAKIASYLKKEGFSCVMAAADTFRAASIEQISKHAERLGVPIIAHQYGSDPASVGFDAIQYAKKNSLDVVLIDTAGRMHSSKNLLKELEKIANVCKPDLKLFIGESITGNDSVEQVKSFDWAIHIDGIILTKADIDEKGGSALSVGFITKKPILFLGTGQEYDKIEVFDKEKFLKELGL